MTRQPALSAEAPTPALRYHGSKWRLAPAILASLPPHRTYVEPFGGSAAVLLQKPRSHTEVYNDLDGRLVNLFRVLRDPHMAAELAWSLRLTPYARQEFDQAREPSGDPVEDARRVVIRSYQGHGAGGLQRCATGFRASDRKAGSHPAATWTNLPDRLATVARRFRRVVIEQRDAFEIFDQHDDPETLFYVDPPYLAETRGRTRYWHDLGSPEDHRRLLEALQGLRGMVVLSGYPSDLYAEELTGWESRTFPALADGSLPREEGLWLNPAASAAVPRLFEGAPA